LAYQSRHNSSEICLALFERAGFQLLPKETQSLSSMFDEIAALLDSYGKSGSLSAN
jgi:hypothetical protein